MKVRLLTEFNGKDAGEVIDVDELMAARLARRLQAEPVAASKRRETEDDPES